MNHSARALAALFLFAATAAAQDSPRLHTHPSVPGEDALQRLNLKLAWRTYISMDGRRDTIYSVQHASDLLLVQTRSGLVCAVEAETGRARWQTRVGRPYHVSVRLGFNLRAIYVVNDQTLYVLDRETGALIWDFDMPSAVTTAPVADNEQVFLSLRGGTVSAYALPRANPDAIAKSGESSRKDSEKASDAKGNGAGLTGSIGGLASATGKGTNTLANVGPLSTARQASRSALSNLEPRLDWSDASGLRLEVAPLQTSDSLFLVGVGGRIAALTKGLKQGVRYERILADGLIVVPPGQHESKAEAYIASQDSNLYAVKIPNGSVKWRFTTGTPIIRKPAVTDEDVYITTDRGGMRRLNLDNGQAIWQNQTADRFLAVNPKIVYATDRAGRMLLLDRAHGTQVGVYDARDFVVPIANDLTDRVYLAAHDGLLICLHDREHAKPHQSKKMEKKPDDKKRGDKMNGKLTPKAPPEIKEPGGETAKDEPLEKKP